MIGDSQRRGIAETPRKLALTPLTLQKIADRLWQKLVFDVRLVDA
jgi:hypothetical protein